MQQVMSIAQCPNRPYQGKDGVFPHGMPDDRSVFKERVHKFAVTAPFLTPTEMLDLYIDAETESLILTDGATQLFVCVLFDCAPQPEVRLSKHAPTLVDGTLVFALSLWGASQQNAKMTLQILSGDGNVLLAEGEFVVRAKITSANRAYQHRRRARRRRVIVVDDDDDYDADYCPSRQLPVESRATRLARRCRPRDDDGSPSLVELPSTDVAEYLYLIESQLS